MRRNLLFVEDLGSDKERRRAVRDLAWELIEAGIRVGVCQTTMGRCARPYLTIHEYPE